MDTARAARTESTDETRAQPRAPRATESSAANLGPEAEGGRAGDPDRDRVAEPWGDESALRERVVDGLGRLRRRIRARPLTAASGAFLLGFAVGNGVPRFLTRAGLAIGFRMVLDRMFAEPSGEPT